MIQHKSMNARELAPTLCCEADAGEMTFTRTHTLTLHPSPPVASGRAGPEVMTARELAPPLASRGTG